MSELTIQDFDETKGLHKWETGEIITAEDLNQNDAVILYLLSEELPNMVSEIVAQELENTSQEGYTAIPSYSIHKPDVLIEGESSGPIPQTWTKDKDLNFSTLLSLIENGVGHIRIEFINDGGETWSYVYSLNKQVDNKIYCIFYSPILKQELIFTQDGTSTGRQYDASGAIASTITLVNQEQS